MILITRPFTDAKAMAAILKKKGFNCFVEPMLEVLYREPDYKELRKNPPQSYITTSKHARIYVPEGRPLAAIPTQGKTASEVAEWVISNLSPDYGRVVYMRGEKVSFDMAKELEQNSFEVEEITVYKTEKPEVLSERLLRNFSKIKLATFMSSETYKNFLKLAEKNKLDLSQTEALFMSKKIANSADANWKSKHIADKPNLDSVIAKIAEVYKL